MNSRTTINTIKYTRISYLPTVIHDKYVCVLKNNGEITIREYKLPNKKAVSVRKIVKSKEEFKKLEKEILRLLNTNMQRCDIVFDTDIDTRIYFDDGHDEHYPSFWESNTNESFEKVIEGYIGNIYEYEEC